MANPFLVLGGIALSVVTAAFGVLQVPGWVASAQDASVTNDLAGVRALQAAAVSEMGAPVTDLAWEGSGIRLTTTRDIRVDTFGDNWCATSQSESGTYFAVTDRNAVQGSGVTAKAAAADAGCVPMPCTETEWSAAYYDGEQLQGPPLAGACLATMSFYHTMSQHPVPGVPIEHYSARFAKTIDEGAGTYNFSIVADDGAIVFVDGVRVFGDFASQSWTVPRTFSVPLTAGPHEVEVHYRNAERTGMLNLSYTVAP